MASATRLSRLAAALGVGLLALALAGVALVPTPAAAVSCTPFGDAGCFMGEDFETFTVGQIPPSPWSPNGRGATDVKIATPGLNGTNKKMRFAVDPDNSGWPGGCQ